MKFSSFAIFTILLFKTKVIFGFNPQEIGIRDKLLGKNNWFKSSWKKKEPIQIPIYKDEAFLKQVQEQLQQKPPLIFEKESNTLKNDLKLAGYGKNFLLMGGDCAETFDTDVNKVKNLYKIILQMGIILTHGTGKKSIKIGRIAGQYAKPRSNEMETVNQREYYAYKGDIINSIELTNRLPDPHRMLDAYQHSCQTLNILRAFSSGGFAQLENLNNWKSDYQDDDDIIYSKYNQTIHRIQQSINFMKGLDVNLQEPLFSQTTLYTGHECLLLPYEEQFIREYEKKSYSGSAHFLWIGDRTNSLNSSQVEFVRGIENPIGLKISSKTNPKELVKIIKLLNPGNEMGKITLITRFGHPRIQRYLPIFIDIITKEKLNVVWCCDPMHGNTFSISGIKTRSVPHIKKELDSFFNIHNSMNTIPAGIHLEMTPENVTECIDSHLFSSTMTFHDCLEQNYKTHCDPRLNYRQSLDIAFHISNIQSNLK